ncbi:hypothetical protein Cob_v005413 [Colletotrichum orbiculare MAFF 240422]|uniref:Uncharacterized protein n=1 Tax=Colletotrichum orbiculare (strain 104-T / ATCC 96160 / CBS 514.97 / LARS 414 / MAFF 240422) TaxID=1213857 RepID=N4VR83_COLOR|nr:hypothetical protein Cob_v005413 [Colletotrichum orbiculare MAFF 240422]
MNTSQESSKIPNVSQLGQRIKTFDITGIWRPPKLMPDFLASDAAGFLLHMVLATDWSSLWKSRLIRAVPVSKKIATTFSDFRTCFQEEWWHTEDLTEERAKEWNPHTYKSPPPRLRSYREILNRQQALKNCSEDQYDTLETREVLRNLIAHVALALCWAWTLVKDHTAVVWLMAEMENDGGGEGYRQKVDKWVPQVVCKGEGVMPAKRGRAQRCLDRVQRRISRGQDLIAKFLELEMCQIDKAEIWDETEWLDERDGDIPADMPSEDRFLLNRLVFSAGLSWFMVSISCDFATFYLLILCVRLRRHLPR